MNLAGCPTQFAIDVLSSSPPTSCHRIAWSAGNYYEILMHFLRPPLALPTLSDEALAPLIQSLFIVSSIDTSVALHVAIQDWLKFPGQNNSCRPNYVTRKEEAAGMSLCKSRLRTPGILSGVSFRELLTG